MLCFYSIKAMDNTPPVDVVNERFFSQIKNRYKRAFTDKKFIRLFVEAFTLLFLSLIANYYAAHFAFRNASNHVEDIILSNIPVYDVDTVFIWGPIVFWIIVSYFLIIDPKKIPFTIKATALFVFIRSLFISLTHLGPFPDRTQLNDFSGQALADFLRIDPETSSVFSSGGDLFFSGHTGIPFLLGLVFWQFPKLRWFCVMSAVFFGIIVLLGHLHYSIDVAAAFFITYTISHMARFLFRSDKEYFSKDN
jgi:hypothetical protein